MTATERGEKKLCKELPMAVAAEEGESARFGCQRSIVEGVKCLQDIGVTELPGSFAQGWQFLSLGCKCFPIVTVVFR